METYPLGTSDIRISPIGLGCWQFSGGRGVIGGFWQKLAPEVEKDIVGASLQGGVNWFDTAEAYGWGRSEEALTDALRTVGVKPNERNVVVATKWFPFFRFARSITKTFPARQGHLAEYPVDLLQIHQPASFSTIPAQMKRMAELIRDGRIRAAGVSNFSAHQMESAHEALKKHGYSLASNQVRYNLLDRRIERNGVLDTAKRLGITIIAYSPLEQGILTGKFHEDPNLIKSRPGPRKLFPSFREKGLARSRPLVEALMEISRSYGVTPAQVALNWLIRFHADRVVAIPGASSRLQAEQNTGAMTFSLSRAELDRLDNVSREVSTAG